MTKLTLIDLYYHLGGIVTQSFAILAMLCLPLHINAKVGDVFTQGNLKFTVLTENDDQGTVSVAKTATSISGELIIPSRVVNQNVSYTVTEVGKNAFEACKSLTGSLTIPNSVTTIGDYAFYECTGFTGSLTIPNSVTTIGSHAFYECNRLTGSLTIPSSVTTIGDNAFFDCKSFAGTLTISNGVTTIGDYAFHSCSGFTGSLTIPSSVTTIGDYAFHSCSGFTGPLTIPSSVTTIADYAFYECRGFTGPLTIPSSVTSIGVGAFFGCRSLTGSLSIPNSVTTIGNYAFYDCIRLTGSLTIPSSVTTIGTATFQYCFGFTGSLSIPNSVTTIGNYAFSNCTGFTGSLSIPNSVTSIGDYAFYDCTGFTGPLTIPNSVTSIGDYAFFDCKGLSGLLSIPSSVTTIGSGAFHSCSSFTQTNIPNSVTKIGGRSFYNCAGLTHICFPSNVITMPGRQTNSTSEETIPYTACNSSLGTFDSFSSLFYMGTDLSNSGELINSKNIGNVYVKPSVYGKYKDDTKYNSLNLSASIPITFPADKKYVTLCRDFDVDLRHANDNLPEGVEPLKAYIVDDANGDLKIVNMNEIKYIPSRLKANVDGYKGMEEYVGVVLKGTPGYTYYYQMGEDDYSKGKDGQMTLEKAMSLSGSLNKSMKTMLSETASSAKANLVGAAQAMEVKTEETEDGVTYKTYGLKNGQFLEYERDGVIPYNKAYLRVPVSKAPSESNAKITMCFNNDDGTTYIKQVDLNKDSILGNAAKDAIYNLQGMKVDNTYHGLVIVNGRKYYKK